MNHPDKLSTDLHRLLKTQDFKNKEELEAFMKNLVGQTIPEFEKEALSFEEQAEDMVMEAQQIRDQQKALIHVIEALEVDPDCLIAYEFFASRQPVPQLALPFFAYAIELGRHKFKKELIEERGHFWGIFETRPFIRCLAQYASCLYELELTDRALAVYKEILELNQNDNMGIRNIYGINLIENMQLDEYQTLDKKFEEEQSAIALFNRLLFFIITKGDSPETLEILKKAKNANKHFIPVLLSDDEPENIPSSYSPGKKDEALYYASFAYYAWYNTEGAIEFLKKNRK